VAVYALDNHCSGRGARRYRPTRHGHAIAGYADTGLAIGYSTSDVVAPLRGHRTCDSQVTGSSPGWAQPRSGLGQATDTYMPLSSSSIIWYRPRGSDAFRHGKYTASLAESKSPAFLQVKQIGFVTLGPLRCA